MSNLGMDQFREIVVLFIPKMKSSKVEKSWLTVDTDSDFPIQNLPFGVFSLLTESHQLSPRIGVAIGDFILDLCASHQEGLFVGVLEFDTSIFCYASLNRFMSLHPRHWSATRRRLISLLIDDEIRGDKVIHNNPTLQAKVLLNRLQATMHLPATIGDYTDFYSSREHATNVGIMFRGPDNALQPNWLHLPVGYHGRSSSVVVSGADVVRPVGQILPPGASVPVFSKCQSLDFELEMAVFVGYSPDGSGHANRQGSCLDIDSASHHIFGAVLMNDWSARDIQAFEYVPLGPFTG